MLKIGLTGGIGSGKSTICQLFSEYNITIIDADIIAHQLVKPRRDCLANIIESFGDHMLLDTGALDRTRMRKLIFSDPMAKQKLEEILHPHIIRQLIEQSEVISSPYCILSIPLLLEANIIIPVDRILIIRTSVEQQLNRVCRRDNISISQAEAIIMSQHSLTQRKDKGDHIVYNNSSLQELTSIVARLHKQYLDIAAQHSHTNTRGL